MIVYHASNQIVTTPEVRQSRFTKDFSWGFYCTAIKAQAVRWANRGVGPAVINIYDYAPTSDLRVLKFEQMNDQWLDFVANCRSGKSHDYDVVEGPMADDTIWNYVNDFVQGTINRRQFWVLAEFRYPTHQISFHTPKALKCLRFTKHEEADGD